MTNQPLLVRPTRVAVVTVALAALGLAVAVSAWKSGEHPAVLAATERPECPYDSVVIKVLKDRTLIRTINYVPLSDTITDIPEFHDCQRFILRKPRIVYDSLYAIFAAFRLETIGLKELPAEGAPVATIYSYGGTYGALGIKPDFNCLRLFGGPTSWDAKMVPWADSSCDHRLALDTAPSTPLEVKLQPITVPPGISLTHHNYPPVARWDWDSVHEQQYIGIRCGAAWCEIGRPGFVQSRPYAGPPLTFAAVATLPVTPAQQVQVTQIKGWYDEQQLATLSPTGRTIVSAVHGWLIPNPALEHPRLDSLTSIGDFAGKWVHVASAVLDGDYQKANLTKGVNKIFLCHEAARTGLIGLIRLIGNRAQCRVPLDDPPLKPPFDRPLKTCDPDPRDGRRWWWKIESSTGKARYVCVKRRDHHDKLQAYRNAHPGQKVWIPAAARWRWLPDDEQKWGKCGSGCCSGQ